MIRAMIAILLALALSGSARAGEVAAADRSAFEAVIAGQIRAFEADDGPGAYGYAAPTIRKIFPTVESFMDMVRGGYRPVYRPQSYHFGEASVDDQGRSVQRVVIVGPDGRTYEAIYTMERQPDGTWKIAGCVLVAVPGLNT
jgi:hypothetical protein